MSDSETGQVPPSQADDATAAATGDEAAPATPEETEGELDAQHLRLLEAVLFTATEPLTEETLAERLPDGAPVGRLAAALSDAYAHRGINLVKAGGRWLFRTAEDLSEQLRVHMKVPRRLSRAAMETLAIIAYHQPVTRAEVEEIRGVGLSRGTLDALMEAGWIGPRGRRRTAGRPVTWGTTQFFLTTFGLDAIGDLPGLDDLKAAGLLDKRPAIQITDVQSGDDDDGDGAQDDEADPFGMDLSEEGGEDDPVAAALADDEPRRPAPRESEAKPAPPESGEEGGQSGAG